jgi:hypothetical protein
VPLNYGELEKFYHDLVRRAREHGVTCAITSGMACVEFGIAETTKDCDLLCSSESAARLLEVLSVTRLEDRLAVYRGNLSPPLDQRWLSGGWTSHFTWQAGASEAYLDVFGRAPRVREPWESDIRGFYVAPHTVAQMKRTNRARDWPFVTAIGVKLLKDRDVRGWLHIYDDEVLRVLRAESPVPSGVLDQRPVLQLLDSDPERLRPALHAEMQFWHELDRIRVKIYERAVRPYVTAVRKAETRGRELMRQHLTRVECAEQHLPLNPLREYGVDRMIAEARRSLAELVNPAATHWLPDVRPYFIIGL